MPFNNPIPGDKLPARSSKGSSGGLQSLVQAEKLMQIAFILPCALLIGWGAGWWVDNHFHIHWAGIAGLLLGIAAGMVSAIRMALGAGNSPAAKGRK
jgi:ATP synthase protein I